MKTKIFNTLKMLYKTIIFLYKKIISFIEGLVDQSSVFYLILLIGLYTIQIYYFNIWYYNNSCSPLLSNQSGFCSYLSVNVYLFIPELLFLWFLFFSIISVSSAKKINWKEFNLVPLAHIIILYLILRFITVQNIDFPILTWLYRNYYLVWEYFIIVVFILFFGLTAYRKWDIDEVRLIFGLWGVKYEKVKEIVEKKEEKEDDFNTRIISSIKTSLPTILSRILSGNNFRKITFDQEGKLKSNLLTIKSVAFEDESHVFVELNVHIDLIDSIWELNKNDWTLWVNSNGKIENFVSAKWRSRDWRNGLIITIKEKTIDMWALFKFPWLSEGINSIKSVFKNPLDFIVWTNKYWKNIVFNLATLPHLLVAWSTGGGKSVWMTNILVSLMLSKLMWNDIEFVIVDPKRVEFSQYKGLEGFDVITDMDKANNILKYAVDEMEKRYQILESHGYKNLIEYNQKWWDMGYMIIIVDEFWDLMTSDKERAWEVEKSIKLLAQKARACWIHIIIATQNPISEVITSSIKANLPSVLWFKTLDWIKSRTIIDDTFLANIKNKGECYLKSDLGLEHMKSFYINNDELNKFLDYYKSQTLKKTITTSLSNVVENSFDVNSDNSESNVYVWIDKFIKSIKDNNLDIDIKSNWFRLFSKIVENHGYKNRDTLRDLWMNFWFTARSMENLSTALKNNWYVLFDDKQKTNILNISLNNDNLLELYNFIVLNLK